MVNTTKESRGMITAKIQARLGLTKNAMIMAPNTMTGERKSRRNAKLMPVCI